MAFLAFVVWFTRLGPEGPPPLIPPGPGGDSEGAAGPGTGPGPDPLRIGEESALSAQTDVASERTSGSTPIERSVLTGRLVDENGVAVPGAEVMLSSGNRRPWAPSVAMPELGRSPSGYARGFSTQSDAAGSFRLEVPTPDPPSVGGWITPDPHHQARTLVLSGQRGGLGPLLPGERDLGEIVLRSAGAISGRVTGPDGEAVGGARIDVGTARAGGYVLHTESDDAGRYLLAHAPPGAYTVNVRAEGYGWVPGGPTCRVRPAVTTERIDFSLDQILPVSGIVVDSEGSPVEGVRVTGWPDASSSASTQVKTDARGVFRLRPVQDRPLALETRRNGYRQVTPKQDLLRVLPGSARIRIVLEASPPEQESGTDSEEPLDPEPPAGEELSGWILADEGVARGGLLVRARGKDEGHEWITTADRQGRFSFPGLPPDSYSVWVEDTPSVVLGMLPMTVVVTAGSPSSTLLDVRGFRPGLVELRVNAEGEPVEGLWVSFLVENARQRGARTDARGAVSLECPAGSRTLILRTPVGVEIARVNMEVSPTRVTGRSVQVKAGRLDLALPEGYALPAELLRLEVTAAPEGEPRKEILAPHRELVPPWEDGRMHLGLIPPGSYLVRVSQTVKGPGGKGARRGASLVGRVVVSKGRLALCQLSVERKN